MREWKKIFLANENQKKERLAILISDKMTLKTVTIDKDGHYIITKGSTQEENITTVNIYTPNIGTPQCLRQILTDIKGEIDSNIIKCVC